MNTIENIIEEIFNPSAKNMRVFKEKILANKDLVKLISGSVKVEGGQKTQIEKKPRAPVQPKANDVRCQAVVWNLEKDEQTGELKPKRCTRGCDGSSTFCKQHGLPDGKRCTDCSNYFGEDIIHQFKHEHMGTIQEPSYIFEKYHNDVLKIYQRSISTPADNALPAADKKEKKTKKTKAVVDESAAPKAKRPLNPYMKYLQENREAIKAELLAANPELKGRDLQTGISKRAGELWKTQPKAASAPEAVVEEHEEDPEVEDDKTDDVVIPDAVVEEQEQQEEDEDTMTLTFDEKLKVWIDEETQLYYEDAEGTDAKGSIVNGSLRPFKVVKKQQ